ncbi:MAG: hypothetical protein NT172_00995 [Planctomycetota bacterium]|nr:hypothetical protein [Planctomycetota bacterium]
MASRGPGFELIQKRHPEWAEHQLRWRWLLDSLEGGQRYRDAIYGYDQQGMPCRNLVRHKREYPVPGTESTAIGRSGEGWPIANSSMSPIFGNATDDDYELRRARTPVPTFLAETVETHLSRIYAREVVRDGSPMLRKWWSDVNGCTLTINQWMVETIAPLLLSLGQIDVIIDRPRIPAGEAVETQADCIRLGLDNCIAGYILPENMVWWKLDESCRKYEECLVAETIEIDGNKLPFFRHWTSEQSTLYDTHGHVIEIVSHNIGRVPIERLFLSRKARSRNVGQSRYEGIAERQREYYNRDSELILSDTTQAHPLMQGPEDFIQPDGSIPIGPGWLLPKKKNNTGNTVTYEGFEVVSFNKDGAESIRRNKADIRDDVDRDSALVRSVERNGQVQSGVAKAIDLHDGNNRLAKLAKALARAELQIAKLVLTILHDGDFQKVAKDVRNIRIEYPSEFDLLTTGELADATRGFQRILSESGRLPLTEGLLLRRLLRLCMPGLADDLYVKCDQEIQEYLNNKVKKS